MAVGNPEPPQPLVSVVIPTYNRAEYLKQALSSVFRQTFTDYEVIVVDDGSTDETPDVLKDYQDRIISLRQENSGAARARNRGIRLARGRWVAFLDSDDMWQPVALERLIAAAAHYPDAGLITMKGLLMKSDGEVTDRIVGKRSPGPSFTTRSLLDKDSGGVLTPMVQRKVLEEVGGYDEGLRTAHDCDLWLRISFRTPMVAIEDALLLRRVHDANASGDQLLNARMWLRILQKLADEHPEFVRDNRTLVNRALAKENLRLGRELLARADQDPAHISEARRVLRSSLASHPRSRRAWAYLLWSLLAPRTYAGWRRREVKARRGGRRSPSATP